MRETERQLVRGHHTRTERRPNSVGGGGGIHNGEPLSLSCAEHVTTKYNCKHTGIQQLRSQQQQLTARGARIKGLLQNATIQFVQLSAAKHSGASLPAEVAVPIYCVPQLFESDEYQDCCRLQTGPRRNPAPEHEHRPFISKGCLDHL